MQLISTEIPSSPARVHEPARDPVVVGLVQTRWHADPDEHRAVLLDGIRTAARAGAQVVFLPELTLSRYPAATEPEDDATATAEDLVSPAGSPPHISTAQLPAGRTGEPPEYVQYEGRLAGAASGNLDPPIYATDFRRGTLKPGPTYTFAAKAAADTGAAVHASLFERADGPDGLGYNTAVLVAPDGTLLGRTHKVHIPVTAGYYENLYFRGGPAEPNPYPVVDLPAPDGGTAARLGLPTCWDQWFPEVARAYSLGGAEIIAYPTAIGSEPDHPGFDTQPLWRQVIIGNGIANGTFMVVPNRWGDEGLITFYGSSFISDPYGRVLVSAPRDADAALVAPLDLDQRRDWLALFPLLATRRPDTYRSLTAPTPEA